MAKATCVICGERAKRVCVMQHNKPICALCCRENVIKPISNCPSECPYYTETFNYLEKKAVDRFDRFLLNEPRHYFMNCADNDLYALFILYKSLLRGLERHPDIKDEDLKIAFDAIRSELIASRSRLIYDGKPLNPRGNEFFLTMMDDIQISEHDGEEMEKGEPKKFILDETPRESVETAFSILDKSIANHQKPDGRGFVSYIQSLM